MVLGYVVSQEIRVSALGPLCTAALHSLLGEHRGTPQLPQVPFPLRRLERNLLFGPRKPSSVA